MKNKHALKGTGSERIRGVAISSGGSDDFLSQSVRGIPIPATFVKSWDFFFFFFTLHSTYKLAHGSVNGIVPTPLTSMIGQIHSVQLCW